MSSKTPQSAGKSTVECPHCGFKQLESSYAKSTYCRKCSEHFELGKSKVVEHQDSRTSIFSRFGELLGHKTTRDITCFDCGASQTVSSSAKSSICPQCSVYIDLSDFKITTNFNRSIQTQGKVYIGAKADVTSTRVACREAQIEGKMRGSLICNGITHINMKGKLMGALEVKDLVIEKRCDVDVVRPIKAKSVEIFGKISARLHVDGTVTIAKKGHLEGTVYAKSIIIEKGGVFAGELIIGQKEFSQQELLPLDTPEVRPPETGELKFGTGG